MKKFKTLRKEKSFRIDFSYIPSLFKGQNNALELKQNILCFLLQQKAKKHQFFKNQFFYSYSTNEKTPFSFSANKIFQCPKEKLIREISSFKTVEFFLTFEEDFFKSQKKKFCVFSPNTNKKRNFQSFELFERKRKKKNTKNEISYFQNFSLTLFFLWIFCSAPHISSKLCFFHSILCFFLLLSGGFIRFNSLNISF